MINPAAQLIDAVQSLNPLVLSEAIKQVQVEASPAPLRDDRQIRLGLTVIANQYDRDRARVAVMNTSLGTTGLTALHVACKAYACHPELRSTFNEMVDLLLKAGASPFVEFGTTYKKAATGMLVVDRQGQTCAEVCMGAMPPALAQFFKEFPSDEGAGVNSFVVQHKQVRNTRERITAENVGSRRVAA